MILEEETKEAFGYYPRDLKVHSCKRILATCDNCGKVRNRRNSAYHPLCMTCALKGNTYALGCERSNETKAAMSTAKKGNTYSFRGGPKVSRRRNQAKRKRELGYTLVMPLADGEVGHHFTDEDVIGIPEKVHQKLGGRRKKHRTLVLQWLKVNDKKKYKMVLCVLAKEHPIYDSKT